MSSKSNEHKKGNYLVLISQTSYNFQPKGNFDMQKKNSIYLF